MSWLVTVAVLGFDLERGRRLAHDHPPPPIAPPTPPSPPSPPPDSPPYAGCDYNAGGRSCDEDFTSSCDEQSADGSWDRSCDVHPSTGCDDWSGCKYPPPPPLAPAPPGGYSPPPETPDEYPTAMIVGWTVLGLVLLIICICCLCWTRYRSERPGNSDRGAFHYYFWCCIECCRSSTWDHDDKDNTRHSDHNPHVRSKQELQDRDARLVQQMNVGVAMAAAVMPPLRLPTGRV
jgi:hypothetical protein